MGLDMSGVRSTISVLSRAGNKARETIQGVDPVDFLVRALKYVFVNRVKQILFFSIPYSDKHIFIHVYHHHL